VKPRRTLDATTVATFVTALVIVLGLSTDPVYALGRLFLSPKERVMLEKRRNALPEEAPLVIAPPVRVETRREAAPPPDVPSIKLDGVVVRSRGSGTAWVNRVNSDTGDLSSQYITVDPKQITGKQVRIKTPGHLPDVDLKPGQTYQPTMGNVVDVYGSKSKSRTAP